MPKKCIYLKTIVKTNAGRELHTTYVISKRLNVWHFDRIQRVATNADRGSTVTVVTRTAELNVK